MSNCDTIDRTMERSPRRTISSSMYRRISLLNLMLQTLIVVTGATVRLTGSGLGCSHWPKCSDTHALPRMSFHAIVEFSNRMISLPLTLVAIVAFIGAWRLAQPRKDLRIASGLVLFGVIAQIVVGGMSVLFELPPLLISAHFLISILILTAASFAWFASRSDDVVRFHARTRVSMLALGTLLIAAIVITAGVLTTAGGPYSGAEARGIVERFGNWHLAVTIHARGAYVFATCVIGLTLWVRRSTQGARDLAILTGLIVLQITLGEIQYRTNLPRGVVLAHIANAAALWTMTTMIVWRSCTTRAEASDTVSA